MKTLTRNLWISRFWGYQKLKLKGGIHWNQGYSIEAEAFGLYLNRNPWFQWNHLWFQFLNPQKRETTNFLSKFHWNRHLKKKMWGFLLKLIWSTPSVYCQAIINWTYRGIQSKILLPDHEMYFNSISPKLYISYCDHCIFIIW